MTKEASRRSKRAALVVASGHPWTYSICSSAAVGGCRGKGEVMCSLPPLSQLYSVIAVIDRVRASEETAVDVRL